MTIRAFTIPAVLSTICAMISGCQPNLATSYAAPRGASINGINGFVDLVKGTGRKTDVWVAVSPKMASDYSAVVIFVSGYGAIPRETAEHISRLMWSESIENLLFVIRDSDCSVDYWQQISEMKDLKDSEIEGARKSLDKSRSAFVSDAKETFDEEAGWWYGLKKVDRGSDTPNRMVEFGSADIEPLQVRWPLNRQLVPAESADVLWRSKDDPLLTIDEDGVVMVMASATPLLNGGLVDPGNRALAARLVDMLPVDGRIAIVASSRWLDAESAEDPGLWKFLKVHPHGWIFGQALVAMILFCWWKFPIFGRPRIAEDREPVRFGRHVEALGTMLQRTRDADFVRTAIDDWRRGEKSRRSSATAATTDQITEEVAQESS